MSRNRKKQYSTYDVVTEIFSELGVKQSEWSVSINFTKGPISKTRGAIVEISNLKSGKKKKLLTYGKTKNEVRKKIADLLKKNLQ